ncbi:MAG TPA: M13 family metallopeptidase [Flavobacterium sp.]|uniref:M13 family metallopeptidase n=1 Tax=unclassified Flavobacterium TaxID=196869 RepID=UPI000E9471A2|nr:MULTISPECIES: M13 family metallopeptidase [unclassified Flavobacterium]HBI00472.1 M13 family peptidase [Flavobacterium sp.]HRE77691.1 M13 family metallopeptidase [Flavobacterium sp.]
MNTIKKSLLCVLTVSAFTGGFAQETKKETIGINLEYMDRSVKPSDDFFRFVNGNWLDKNEIPADRTRWGSFDELRKKTDDDMKVILNEALLNPAYTAHTDQGKALNLYRSIMDTVSRDRLGIKPLEPYLKKINAVKNVSDLKKLLIEMETQGGIGFFGVGVGTDAKNSNRNVVNVGLGSLGLPDRDYYVSDEKDSKEKREKYHAHIIKMMSYLGEKPAQAKASADKILALEIAMATPRLDRVERRDRRKTYNPMTVGELQKLTPTINWAEYLKGVGLPVVDTLIVSQPKYMTALETIFKENKVEDWKAYMRWTLLNRSAGMLSTEIGNANWEFFGKTLTGAVKQRPLDERALQTVNGSFGEALGKIYVEKKFPPEAKEKARKMIDNVFLAFENRINNLPWMAPSTRANAIAKLKKFNVKIGYPDKWKDYSKVTIVSPKDGGTYFENSKRITKWRNDENFAKLGKPVDKTEWGMSPQTVNAYYSPSFNEIVFPAAILQPPFYDYRADEAVNYGGIGAVIGHEISHGFDDSGSRYNADGNLVNWWSDEDLKQFTELGGALADQYSQLEPLPGIFVDGKFTLGENIGDLGGVSAALDGLKIHLKESGNPGLIDGFTPEQRFFISWATIWRSKARDEAIKNLVKTDTHSPGQYRAYVPLQNVDAFYEAFNIKPGDGMYIAEDKRVRIW